VHDFKGVRTFDYASVDVVLQVSFQQQCSSVHALKLNKSSTFMHLHSLHPVISWRNCLLLSHG